MNIQDIDEAIIPLILTLNSYEGIKTAGSCSGHVQNGNARCYISFEDTKHENLNQILEFFKEFGFKVKFDYDSKWWNIDLILEKGSGNVVEDDIRIFWEVVEEEMNNLSIQYSQ